MNATTKRKNTKKRPRTPKQKEPWVTQVELAVLMGVVPLTIRRWRDAGMPYNARRRRYEVPACVGWREERVREEARASMAPKSYDEARMRKIAAEAEMVELDLMIKRRELGSIEEFDDVVTAGLGRMRAYGLGIPSRHARDFVGLKTVTAARNGLKQIIIDLFEAFHEMREEDEAA